jgi:hypothetical protein
VEIGDTKRRISRASAEFFLDWFASARRSNSTTQSSEPRSSDTMTRQKSIWQEVVAKANAE